MDVRFLLLDCSPELEATLIRQGFNIASGSVFREPMFLPAPMYEYDVIIYDPQSAISGSAVEVMVGTAKREEHRKMRYAGSAGITTSQIERKSLNDHIYRNATILAFVKCTSQTLIGIDKAYSWIPLLPPILTTHDLRPISAA